jgi:dihydrofolate synthase/folylpolyglutamate synthase
MKESLAQRYRKTVEFIYGRLPMYHRIGVKAYKKDMQNIRTLLEFLGNPHERCTCIHVGGTNGKGSTSHMISAVLQAHGIRTGLFISPHYRDYRERVKVNGILVDKAFVVEFIARIQPLIEAIQPSFFEMTAAMAFEYFARQQVQAAVVEVGLGGRLDSTNVISPVLSVITNISYDHMHLLGNTLPEIAFEKAGIIKAGVPVVIGESHPESAPVFSAKAAAVGAPVYFADQHFHAVAKTENFHTTVFDVYRDGKLFLPDLELNLGGGFQRLNLQTVIQATELLKPVFHLKEAHIRAGLAQVRQLTNITGRWELIGENPPVLADSAHNESGIAAVMQHLAKISFQHLHIVIGMVSDKDLDAVFRFLPRSATYYFARADVPRAMDAEKLRDAARLSGFKGRAYRSVRQALQAAKRRAAPPDLILVCGSVFVVAEVV